MCHNHTKGHTVGSQYPWEGAYCPPKTQDELLGLIVDDNNSADAATTITSADDIIIIDDKTKKIKKDRKPWRKKTIHQ